MHQNYPLALMYHISKVKGILKKKYFKKYEVILSIIKFTKEGN